MHRQTLFSILLALVLAVAGCSSVGPPPTPTATTTPAPIPTAPPTPTPVAVLAPGMTTNGVQNAEQLTAAHNAILATTSHTVFRTETQTYANGTVRSNASAIIRRVPTANRSFRHTDFGNPPQQALLKNVTQVEAYREGDQLYVAITNATRTTYLSLTSARVDGAPDLPRPAFWLLSGATTRVTARVTQNNTTQYRLTLEEITDPATRWHLLTQDEIAGNYTAVRNVTFRARIDSHGFIHAYQLTFTKVQADGTAIHVTRTVRYRALGTTSVNRPAWYDEAVANTSEG